jgi:hypothetical protein
MNDRQLEQSERNDLNESAARRARRRRGARTVLRWVMSEWAKELLRQMLQMLLES